MPTTMFAGEYICYVSIDMFAHAAQTGAALGIAASAHVDFSNTISFARDRPVFDLPEGWTVNSVSANIVNNRWVDVTVPEPTSALLGLFAAAGFGAFANCRKHRKAHRVGIAQPSKLVGTLLLYADK